MTSASPAGASLIVRVESTASGWSVICNDMPLVSDLTDAAEANDVARAYRILFHDGYTPADHVYAQMLVRSCLTRHEARSIEGALALG